MKTRGPERNRAPVCLHSTLDACKTSCLANRRKLSRCFEEIGGLAHAHELLDVPDSRLEIFEVNLRPRDLQEGIRSFIEQLAQFICACQIRAPIVAGMRLPQLCLEVLEPLGGRAWFARDRRRYQ